MRLIAILFTASFFLIVSGCANSTDSSNSVGQEEQIVSDPLSVSSSVNLPAEIPVFSQNTPPSEFQEVIETIMGQINEALPNLELVERDAVLLNQLNIHAKVYYDENKLPVKIEPSSAAASGEISALSEYYFINGKLWCSYDVFAIMIFEEDKLKYLLNEAWTIQQLPEANMQATSNLLNQMIGTMLGE